MCYVNCVVFAREEIMSKRRCAVCNKDKDMAGGKICEKGHFICADHIYSWMPGSGEKTTCPVCKTKLT